MELKLKKAQYAKIIAATFPDYTGRKVTLEFRETLTVYNTNWCEGTKNEYAAIRSDGRTAKFDAPAPWLNMAEGKTVNIPQDALIVERTYYRGEEWVTVYAHPCHLPKWLTA